MLSRNLGVTHDAVAATGGTTFGATCNTVSEVAYVPDTIAATIGWTTTIGALPTCASSIVVGVDVANDTDPTATCGLGPPPGNFIGVSFTSPAMKVGGLQCTNTATVSLAANTTADAGSNLEIYIDDVNAPEGNGSNKVDQLASRMLFGDGGAVKVGNVVDGEDFDLLINGEVQFGKTTGTDATGANGTSKTFMRIDHTNNTTTPSETIVFTFTSASS